MRTIKFRGKSKRTGEWLYGDLVRNVEGAFAVVPPFEMNTHNECSTYEVDEKAVGQFTGFTDCVKREIYENDILYFEEFGNNYTVVVKWNEEIGTWSIQLSYETRLGSRPLGEWLREERLEVIGNVFDNPELLKGGEV